MKMLQKRVHSIKTHQNSKEIATSVHEKLGSVVMVDGYNNFLNIYVF